MVRRGVLEDLLPRRPAGDVRPPGGHMLPRAQQFLLIRQVEVAIAKREVAQIRDANGIPGQVLVLRELGLVHIQDLRELS